MAKRDALRSDSEEGRTITPPPEHLDEFARILGHGFARPALLAEALVHPSTAQAGAARGYERFEFLGDRVLGLVVADLLFEAFPGEDEGGLAKRYAHLVRRETLAAVARRIGLGRYLVLAKGEREAGGADRPANLADALEAVIGALYRDGGLDAAARFVRREWVPLATGRGAPPKDAKTALQEFTQARFGLLPAYRVVAREGPAHAPSFVIEVAAGGECARGQGESKRVAEQAAAQALLVKLKAPAVGEGN